MVIGDIIADEFIVGQPERLSREAPVLILRHQGRQILPGGGANAGNNIRSLGGEVRLVGIIGEDHPGHNLKSILEAKKINTEGLIIDKNRPTSLKTRVLAGGDQVVKQQVVRVDHLDTDDINRDLENNLLSYVNQNLDQIDGLLLSDYGNGIFTERVKEELIKMGKEQSKFIAVDSRYDLLGFEGTTIATPNLEEVSYALKEEIEGQSDVIKAGFKLIKKLKSKYLLITQGGEGMTLFTEDGNHTHVPVANYSEVYDVTGAGDTVVGTLILALGAGADPVKAMKLANYAAGIVVRKNGVATVSPRELKEELVVNEKEVFTDEE